MKNTYVIGDVQGCYDDLCRLLENIQYDDKTDQLWFAGDLINRGPKSLQALRFIKKHASAAVLGNHDIHLIAKALGFGRDHPGDTFDEILTAPDCDELIDWLRHLPLMHHEDGFSMVHAGLIPSWDLAQAMALAQEAQRLLASGELMDFLPHLYGDTPECWHDNLSGFERVRFIINVFTRLRICTDNGQCDFRFKGPVNTIEPPYLPWFKAPSRKTQNDKILFGHWAALECQSHTQNVYALDSGCVWGNHLTAMRLTDGKLFTS